MNGWKEISEILKKEVKTSKLSLLEFANKVNIEVGIIRRYFDGDFSGNSLIVEKHLRKIMEVFNIEEDLILLYELGKNKEISKKFNFSNISLYIFFGISLILFVLSVILFWNIYNKPLVKLKALNDKVYVNGKAGKVFFLSEGEYVVKGSSIINKINRTEKIIKMEDYKVVIKWEK